MKGEPCKFVAGHSARVRRRHIVDGTKQCPRCAEWKPLADFNRTATRPDGHDVYCRVCMSAKHRKWNQANRQQRTERAREFRASRPDYQRQNVARWRERNYEHHLAQARIYAAARRARLRDQFVEHVDAFAVYDRDGGICGICGDAVERSDFHVDHVIPLVRGGEHSYANVQVAHPSCNSRKRDKILEAA